MFCFLTQDGGFPFVGDIQIEVEESESVHHQCQSLSFSTFWLTKHFLLGVGVDLEVESK